MNFGSVRQGMQVADRMLNDAAGKIAKGGTDAGVEPLVALNLAKVQQAASIKVAKTMSETLGTLVNLHV